MAGLFMDVTIGTSLAQLGVQFSGTVRWYNSRHNWGGNSLQFLGTIGPSLVQLALNFEIFSPVVAGEVCMSDNRMAPNGML